MTMKGALVAGAVAGLFAAATPAVVKAAGGDAKVHCMGINDCKGKGMCQSATTSCKGQNTCKGKGWVEATEKECTAKKGKVVK
jgi:hypothetical protein